MSVHIPFTYQQRGMVDVALKKPRTYVDLVSLSLWVCVIGSEV